MSNPCANKKLLWVKRHLKATEIFSTLSLKFADVAFQHYPILLQTLSKPRRNSVTSNLWLNQNQAILDLSLQNPHISVLHKPEFFAKSSRVVPKFDLLIKASTLPLHFLSNLYSGLPPMWPSNTNIRDCIHLITQIQGITKMSAQIKCLLNVFILAQRHMVTNTVTWFFLLNQWPLILPMLFLLWFDTL